MKTLRILILTLFAIAPACTYAQSGDTKSRTTRQTQQYQRKTTKHQVKTADSSDLNAILKDSANAETGPILNDNGNVNSSGSVDGSRSSTGRPDADTTSYTVKRKKKTVIRTNTNATPDATGGKPKRP